MLILTLGPFITHYGPGHATSFLPSFGRGGRRRAWKPRSRILKASLFRTAFCRGRRRQSWHLFPPSLMLCHFRTTFCRGRRRRSWNLFSPSLMLCRFRTRSSSWTGSKVLFLRWIGLQRLFVSKATTQAERFPNGCSRFPNISPLMALRSAVARRSSGACAGSMTP